MRFTSGRRGPAALLAALAATTLAVSACDDGDGDPPSESVTSSASPSGAPGTGGTPVAADECVDVEHQGQKLGLTAPAGFTVDQPPDDKADIAETYKVNHLADIYRMPAGGQVPEVAVSVFGYGKDERTGESALTASILRFTVMTGGTNRTVVEATPTTIAGVPGTAGSREDNRALDQSGDPAPTPIHYWTLPTTDQGVWVVAMAARTTALDEEFRPKVLAGLKPGGC